MPAARDKLLPLVCAAALGCTPRFEYGSEDAPGALAGDAGGLQDASESATAPDLLPRAWLGVHCAGGDSALQLVLTASTTSCAEAAALLRDGAEQSYIKLALSPAGAERVEGLGQRCAADGCRSLPATVQIDAHPAGGAARGSYRVTEGGELLAEGSFTTAACAFDEVGAAQAVVDRVTISQAVDIPLYEAGATLSEPNAPVIAGRPAQLRVFLHDEGGASARKLSAQLRLTQPEAEDQLFEASLQLGATPGSYADLSSTLNFDLPAAAIEAGSALQLSLLDADGCPAAFRDEDALASISLGVQADLHLRVVFVPITYQGTAVRFAEHYVPKHRAALLAHYPLSERQLSVELSELPLSWDEELLPHDSSSWVPLLAALEARREADGASPDTFYFGLFPRPDGFCDDGCVTGVAPRNLSLSAYTQVGVGLYYSSATLIHELGHAFGRSHTSCTEVSSTPTQQDEDYPYEGGTIGRWGTEISEEGTSLHPDTAPDFMGYCSGPWISDYTYRAIYERLALIHAHSGSSLSHARGGRWRLLSQAGAKLAWAGQIALSAPPGGEAVAVSYLAADGAVIAEATAYKIRVADLEDAGQIILPLAPEGAVAIQLDGYGQLAL